MNTKSWYENDKRGYRKSTSTGANITGSGADIIIVDDPQDPEKGESEKERNTVKRHYGKTLYSRLNDQQVGVKIVMQQRLHEDDLTGHLLANDPNQYHHICIPAEITDDISPKLLKKNYIDGLFCPKRFPRIVLDDAKLPSNLGAFGYAGQYLQKPSPPEGGIFKRWWWNYWAPKGTQVPVVTNKDGSGKLIYSKIVALPDNFQQIIDSWDLALDGNLESDDVCGSKWGKNNANKFLLNRMLGKMNYPESKKAIIELYKSNIATSSVVIERAANGPAVKSDLENEIPGIITKPTGRLSKEDRVKISDTVPYAAQVESGNIYLPHPSIAPWVNEWIDEHAKFPKCAQDGQVDTGSQAINHLTTAKYIWNYYSAEDTHHLNIDWSKTFSRPTKHYGAIFQEKDLSMYGLEALWDTRGGKLYIYGCWSMENPNPITLAPQIAMRMQLKQYKADRILCNKAMYNSEGYVQTTAKVLKSQFKKMRLSQVISEPIKYDQSGAIMAANQLFMMKKVFVDKKCSDAARQFSGWIIEKDKPSTDESAYCNCLCMIISELRRSKALIEIKKIKDYQPAEIIDKKLAKRRAI